MKRVAYAEQIFGTDEHLADLVLEYARLLAHGNSSDTVTVPGRTASGDVEPITLLIGPASQITAWPEEGAFDVDVSDAVADLEHRIRARTTFIAVSDEDPGPALDEFDDLA